ncbi:hypothetical protein [[Leptolyngbya] sp. PCC 7376]|uniref:hypothetical protein n=1 Tax=[Leptolyngbya] sp. PCC 7376 TaxID=111781 RepID=UPI000300242E|nr:hypothetical protein [[Leptolyngbya] sp. PCC 7376]
MFEYQLDNGGIIRATPDHKFLTADGRMLAIDTIFQEDLELADYANLQSSSYQFFSVA